MDPGCWGLQGARRAPGSMGSWRGDEAWLLPAAPRGRWPGSTGRPLGDVGPRHGSSPGVPAHHGWLPALPGHARKGDRALPRVRSRLAPDVRGAGPALLPASASPIWRRFRSRFHRSAPCMAPGAATCAARAWWRERSRVMTSTPRCRRSQATKATPDRSGKRAIGRRRGRSTTMVPQLRPLRHARSSTPITRGAVARGSGVPCTSREPRGRAHGHRQGAGQACEGEGARGEPDSPLSLGQALRPPHSRHQEDGHAPRKGPARTSRGLAATR